MTKIAFLGLGNMGAPMATRLLHAGHDVTVWNRTPSRAAIVGEAGAIVANSPAAAVAGADLAITMLADPGALNDVLFGPAGLSSALSFGQTIIDMSTVGPAVIQSAAVHLPRGVTVIDAPVRGSVPEATAGTLQIYVGATDDDFVRVSPILGVLGDAHHVGAMGMGAAMKLVVNSTLAASIVALGEGLSLGQALGLDRSILLDVLAESPVGSTVRAKRGNIEAGRYPPGFKVSLAAKDMRLVTEAANEAGVFLPAAMSVRARLDDAVDEGAADLDLSAVVATIARSSFRR